MDVKNGLLVLWNPLLRVIWATSLWSFHLGVLLSMLIAFPYPLSGVAFACLFRCERLWHLRGLARVRGFLLGVSGAGLQAPASQVKL